MCGQQRDGHLEKPNLTCVFFFPRIILFSCFYILKMYLKKFKFFLFFYFKLVFFLFLDYFDALISKIIFLKNFFNTFLNEKHFKKQPQP
jgi:hypothetical protein